MKKIVLIIVFLVTSIVIYAQNEVDFIENDRDSVFYEVRGTGRPVLLLSGGPGGSPRSLNPIVEYISQNNKSILLHQRGTGLSTHYKIDSSTITLNQYIDDIDKILIKENVGDDLYIIGHSWGAMLGLDYAVKNPTKVKGLILIGSSGSSLDFVQAMNNEIFRRMSQDEMDSLKLYFGQLSLEKEPSLIVEVQNKIGALTMSKQFWNPALTKELEEYGSLNLSVNSLMLADLKKEKWNLQDEIRKLNIPIIIINGVYDPIPKVFVERTNEALPNGKLYFLENCGHYVWIEKAEELQKIIESFLVIY